MVGIDYLIHIDGVTMMLCGSRRVVRESKLTSFVETPVITFYSEICGFNRGRGDRVVQDIDTGEFLRYTDRPLETTHTVNHLKNDAILVSDFLENVRMLGNIPIEGEYGYITTLIPSGSDIMKGEKEGRVPFFERPYKGGTSRNTYVSQAIIELNVGHMDDVMSCDGVAFMGNNRIFSQYSTDFLAVPERSALGDFNRRKVFF